MAFFLFIVLNAILFLRPSEFLAEIQGLNLYLYVILPTILLSTTDIFQTLFARPIENQPLTVCVFGMFFIIMVPHLLNADLAELFRTASHYFKMVVYYVLFISLVTTPNRLYLFFASFAIFCATMTTVTILNHFDFITIPDLPQLISQETDESGAVVSIRRLVATGLFKDPNDLCVLLATAIVPTLYLVVCDREFARKLIWLTCLGIMAYGIYLTKSRGGYLALAGAMAAALYFRLGWQRFLVCAVIATPIFVGLLGMMLLDKRGTSTTRIQLWSDWLVRFKEAPVFGEGMNLTDESQQKKDYNPEGDYHLAHNSYIQAFADKGFIGGSLFLGGFLLANWILVRISFLRAKILDRDLEEMQPYVVGMVTAYSLGMCTLTLCYYIPTVAVLAIATAYVRMTPTWPPLRPVTFDVWLPAKFAFASIVFIVCLYIFLRIFLRWT